MITSLKLDVDLDHLLYHVLRIIREVSIKDAWAVINSGVELIQIDNGLNIEDFLFGQGMLPKKKLSYK